MSGPASSAGTVTESHPLPRTTCSIFVPHASALLTDHEPHGDGLLAYEYVSRLARRGHEIHVAAPRVRLREPLPEGAHVHLLSAHTRLGYMAAVRRLFGRLGTARRFDVIHQLNPVDVGISLALAGRDVPIVLGPYVPDWPPAAGEASPRAALHRARTAAVDVVKERVRGAQQRRAAALLLSSPAAVDKVVLPPGGGPAVHDLPYGVDADAFTPADELVEPEHDVLFLATLHTRKGIWVLLDALDRLDPGVGPLRVLIAGGGPRLEEVRRRLAGSRHEVDVIGRVERTDVRELLRSSAVYCLPSYGEPFGMSALEAMACGRPVVATDAGGLVHLVDDAGGRRVRSGDPEALAAALAELLADRDLREAMGAYNRRKVEEHYTWPHVLDRLERVYADARTGR